ncbi:hypothetical protein [Leisingera sp. F5]|uniref:hypothetical protein n=1 Tax=Leisingera sp. F5 TaxID=1813816 RepID=UPI000B08A3CF|nr:hypothetical protein [Leisingera sp. F5]
MDEIRNEYFAFEETNRDFRGSFNGIMVKRTCTKAAHLACLRDMLPSGKITLAGEQDGTMTRVVPHVFRDMINEDLFEWFVITFGKNAATNTANSRIEAYEEKLAAFKEQAALNSQEIQEDHKLLSLFCAQEMRVAIGADLRGSPGPFPISSHRSVLRSG